MNYIFSLITKLYSLIESLLSENEVLKARVSELENQNKTNSSNSSKPPSKDGLNFIPNSKKPKSSRKVGGQPGHKGSHLPLSDTPDEIITYRLPHCIHCSEDLSQVPCIKNIRRQVVDIPPPPPLKITEHQVEVVICPRCNKKNRGVFPADLTANTQYGPHLLSVLMLLVHQQALPYKRVAGLMKDIYNVRISQATVFNATEKLALACTPFVEEIASKLNEESVVNVDESGLKVEKTNQWVHVICSKLLVHYFISKKRGSEAIDTHLKDYTGTAVHDGWKSYQKYSCQHGLCNAHHLRELNFVYEVIGQKWALDFKVLLTEAYLQTIKGEISEENQASILLKAQKILDRARKEQPPPLLILDVAKKNRKKTKAENLINRLEKYSDQVWLFIKDPNVPFDNNLAERNIRMLKVMQKVKGCFRTIKGAEQHLIIRSFFMTARNLGQNIIEEFAKLLAPAIA